MCSSDLQIGQQMGDKNHTTVLIASRRIEQALAAEGELQWRTADGLTTAPAGEIVAELEQSLGLGQAASA